MKWKEKMDEFGLTEQTISKGLGLKIKDYFTLRDGIDELAEQIQNPSEDDDVDALEEDLKDLESTLEVADIKLVKAVELYNKNKDVYAELAKKLPKGRPKKSSEPTPTPIVEPIVEPTPIVIEPEIIVEPIVEPKKKSDISFLIFAVFAAVVTVGAVRLFKDRN